MSGLAPSGGIEYVVIDDILSRSLHKNVGFVELLNVVFDLRQFFLVALLPRFQPVRIHQPHVSQLLVLVVHLIPFVLQSLPDGCHFRLRQAIIAGLVFLVQIPDHAVFVVDILLDPIQVLGSLPVVFLLGPLGGLGGSLGHRQNILDRVRYDEVFARAQPLHWLLMHARDCCLFMLAIVGEVLRDWQLFVPHRPCHFFQKVLRVGLSVPFEVAQSLGLPELGVPLQPPCELARKVRALNERTDTWGLEVVWLPKMEPVGGMLGGYLER